VLPLAAYRSQREKVTGEILPNRAAIRFLAVSFLSKEGIGPLVSARKPPGYWHDSANLEREILSFIAQHGQAGIMPTVSDLKQHGYIALVRAISDHGGFLKIAKSLGLQVQDKRKPPSYWNDFAKLERELRIFVAEHGQSDRMPTEADLVQKDRWDLAVGIRQHGGVFVVAQRLGLNKRRIRKPDGYWDDFAHLEEELQDFLNEQGLDNVMPTNLQIEGAGRRDLIDAISKHGGSSTVAERLGLSPANANKPSGYWRDFGNIEREVRAFVLCCGQEGQMPTRRDLKRAGRGDLVSAIAKHGGLTVVATRLGLQCVGRRDPHC